jgi:hypothetical protein
MHPDFCMISDRPAVLTVDSDNRPHNDDGPFCRWRDGTALYSIHGARVPAKVVERPGSLSFAEVRDEPDAEIRRHMLDRFGGLRGAEAQSAWILSGGLKSISQEDITSRMQPSGLSIWRMKYGDAPVMCKLYRADLQDDEPLTILMVVCTSTAKEVSLRVPPNFNNAKDARNWTFGDNISLSEAIET